MDYYIVFNLTEEGKSMCTIKKKYAEIIDFLKRISMEYCKNTDIKIHIVIPDEDKLNASVRRIGEKDYRIKIYPLVFNIDYCIEQITSKFSEDDLQFFFRFKHINIFEKHEGDSYRDELNHLFNTIILLHIFWHEIGHIEAGHFKESHNYDEFDKNKMGSYLSQEKEMVADWIATLHTFSVIYKLAIEGKVSDEYALIAAIKQSIVLYWLSLTMEFQIFDSKHVGHVDDLSKLRHPHPAVRLLYNIEALAEAIVNIFNLYGLNDEAAEKAMSIVVKDIYIIIESFLQIMNSPINVKKDEKRMMECYKTLRELPYTDGYIINDYRHLEPMDASYAKMINSFLSQ